MLWASLRLPPGVDHESKLSNMFVFDFAPLDSTKLSWSSVKRIRIKRHGMLWSSLRLPPGVERESKISNMFVFYFAFLTAMKFNLVVPGIPVHGRVMKPRFQNMEKWSDVFDFLTNHEWIMVLICWFLWASARVVCLPVEDTPYADSKQLGSCYTCLVWLVVFDSFESVQVSPIRQ